MEAAQPIHPLRHFLKATPFEPVSNNFAHKWDKKVVFPFTGGAAIDINNDGSMEVFVSGGNKQGDALLSLKGGKLINIVKETGLSQQVASYAVDIDNNGHTDLLVARNDGVWLHLNKGNGKFDSQRINYNRGNNEAPMTVALADINHDNDMDLYISNFITFTKWKSSTFNQPGHIQYNRLLRNDGNLKFTDITKSAGVAGSQNITPSVKIVTIPGWGTGWGWVLVTMMVIRILPYSMSAIVFLPVFCEATCDRIRNSHWNGSCYGMMVSGVLLMRKASLNRHPGEVVTWQFRKTVVGWEPKLPRSVVPVKATLVR